MRWTDEVKIETPEQIDVVLEVAGLGSRFLARALDWCFKFFLVLSVAVPAFVIAGLLGAAAGERGKPLSMIMIAVILGVCFAILLAYDIYFEARHNGQTPGKKHAGIRVVRDNGAPVDFRTACIRNLLSTADFLPVFYFLGGLLVLLTGRHQRLGDLAAGTLVIRERVSTVPGDVAKMVERLASQDVSFTAEQLATCAPESLGIMRSFFQRYFELEPGPRHKLACRLVTQFSTNMAAPPVVPPAGNREAEVFLASLYRDFQAVRQHGQ
jgi:uncharacterized RDD family membrane protein YckC